MRLAKRRGRDYAVLPEEEKLREKLRGVEAALEQEQKEAAALAAAERKERQAALLARPEVVAFTQSGRRIYGTPVVGREWEALPDGKGAVEVASYNAEIGEAGAPISAFFVNKSRGGRCERERMQEGLSYSPPPRPARAESGAPIAKATGVLLLETAEGPVEVFHFDKENFRILRKQGVNSGALVAVGEPAADGRYTIVLLDGKDYMAVGQGKPLQ
jgi:hypothetical protein